MKTRDHTFDLLCGLCMLGFVVALVTDKCRMHDATWAVEIRRWTYLAVGLFFFKSGYFSPEADAPLSPLLRRKARRLLLPYVVWGVIGTVVYFGFLHFFPSPLHVYQEAVRREHVLMTAQWYGNAPLWVLPCLFCSSMIAELLRRLRGMSWAACLLPAAGWWIAGMEGALWSGLGSVSVGVYLYMLGHWWARAERSLSPAWAAALSALLTVGGICGNLLWHGEYDLASNQWTPCAPAAIVNASLILCGLTGLLHRLTVRRVPLIGFVGEHSMGFLVMAYPMIIYYNFVHTIGKRTMTNHWNDFIAVSVLVVCLCAWLAPYVEACPWMSGRRKEPTSTQ